ncbi:MAG: type IV pilus modification protein PilV [Sideroxydans sp.]|nr:type IV pilus modification protein PilV [Sideroxydans sp.]
MNHETSTGKQSGSVILEALIAILIFSVGILALVGMQATAINNVSDAKYRADAGFLTDQIIGMMWANRVATTVSGVTTYAPDPTFACNTASGVCANATVQQWAASDVAAALPNSTANIAILGSQASVTLTWQPPKASTPHRHTAVAIIN